MCVRERESACVRVQCAWGCVYASACVYVCMCVCAVGMMFRMAVMLLVCPPVLALVFVDMLWVLCACVCVGGVDY